MLPIRTYALIFAFNSTHAAGIPDRATLQGLGSHTSPPTNYIVLAPHPAVLFSLPFNRRGDSFQHPMR